MSKQDYRKVVVPALRNAIATGEVRLRYLVAPDFEKVEIGARIEDVKADFRLGLAHRSAWKRSAVVTDVGWIARSFRLFDRFTPGETRAWGLADEQQARAWLIADPQDNDKQEER